MDLNFGDDSFHVSALLSTLMLLLRRAGIRNQESLAEEPPFPGGSSSSSLHSSSSSPVPWYPQRFRNRDDLMRTKDETPSEV
ncbi:hypothetical protein CCHR01_15313 [Colletotrichum chrysophilum]|uniref:Uncharacterized protein n=1 Tax=Colletotrichum chrysophilum TaxID=1836956 RepID=A0AAD9EBX5_9PEZI|nr:hypothetical protein CCHR01_15313 [Colletotrichum chrysophilum]